MKLLWLSHLVPYPPKGGVRQRSYHLLREAAKRWKVDFCGLVQTSQQGTEEAISEACRHLEKLCNDLRIFRIPNDSSRMRRMLLLGRNLFSAFPYDVNWLECPEMMRHLNTSNVTYDLVHVDTIGLTPYTDAQEECPIVLNHHNIESQMMQDRAQKESNPLKKAYMEREAGKLRAWEGEWAPNVAINTVVSPLDAKRLRNTAGEVSTHVVENGVDVEYFKPQSSPDTGTKELIFVGGMSWYPNRDAVLWFAEEIWPRLVEDRPSLRARLIGRDPPDRLVEMAEKDERISVPGFVDDIRPAVDSAFAYICPIRKGGGTRLKVLDALAMGKPLIGTAFSVQGLSLEEGVHYLRAETPEEYVEQIRRLERDPVLRRRLSKEGRRLVEEHYAWETIGDHLEHAYEKALRTAR